MAGSGIVTIGNFDGVHLGHRAIVEWAGRLAQQHDAAVTVLTFDPHPASVLRPGSEPPRLTGCDEKVALLRAAGADDVMIMQPTPALLALSPQQFVQRLVDEHRPIALVEGHDFRFGNDRAGDVALLAALGRQMAFATHVVEPVEVALSDHLIAPVRSSLIRWLVRRGRMLDASLCLGRPLAISGAVVTGDRRGRTIGVPTANLDAAALAGRVVPADGVYAARARLADGSSHPAAVSIGAKPTFAGGAHSVEAHLLGFDGGLYGQTITIQFGRWLRDQQAFPGVEALRAQLLRDIAAVRQLDDVGLLMALPKGRVAQSQRAACAGG